MRGTDAMSSGVRLLPLVAGLLFGAPAAERLARRLGAKVVVGGAFAVLAAGFGIGAATGVRSSGAFVLGWTAAVGVGLGLAFATSASAAVSQLPEKQSGIGAAVMQALQKTSGPFGSAILGSVISAGYISHLHVTGLSPGVARTARESVFAATAVAARLGDPQLLNSARASFVNGMDHALLVSAALAVAGAALASVFLPGRSANSLTAI